MITVKYNHSTFDSLLIANIGFAWERKFRDRLRRLCLKYCGKSQDLQQARNLLNVNQDVVKISLVSHFFFIFLLKRRVSLVLAAAVKPALLVCF